MRILVFCLVLLASLTSAALAQPAHIQEIRERLRHANQWRDHVMVVAHRGGGMEQGNTKYPENSLEAVRHAIAIGAEMVEIDVQRSADGVYVVFHDSWLDRTSNCRGRLAERTLAQLKACRLVVAGTGATSSETLPTLEEMLSVTKDRIMVNIDNKLDADALPGIVDVARRMGMADQLVIKANLWNDARVSEMRSIIAATAQGVIFMPIVADDAVTDPALLEHLSAPFTPDAVELITWRAAEQGLTQDGGPLFGARARAVAIRGDWHIWVNTYAIVNKQGGMLAGGRGDELATVADLPDEAFGFWVDRGATMIQTDEPTAAIEWLTRKGYRIPYGLTN